jgi:hypothetical protein
MVDTLEGELFGKYAGANAGILMKVKWKARLLNVNTS